MRFFSCRVALALCGALAGPAVARAQTEGARRTDTTLAVQSAALAIVSFAPLVGNGLSLARGEPWSLGQYVAGYGLGAADLAVGIWGLTRLSGSDRWEKALVTVSLASGISNLAVALYGTVRRADGRPAFPVGGTVMTFLLGTGMLASGIAEMSDRAGDGRLGAGVTVLGAVNLALAVYDTLRRSEARRLRVVPAAGRDAAGQPFFALALEVRSR